MQRASVIEQLLGNASRPTYPSTARVNVKLPTVTSINDIDEHTFGYFLNAVGSEVQERVGQVVCANIPGTRTRVSFKPSVLTQRPSDETVERVAKFASTSHDATFRAGCERGRRALLQQWSDAKIISEKQY